jgi:predicted TIM-barrel fold metal-dependent hydrolase
MPVIDINVHHLPEDLFSNEKILNGFLSTAPVMQGWSTSVFKMESGKMQMDLQYPKGTSNLNYVEGDYSAAAKLSAMDDAGVDYAILRVPVWQEWLRLETCKEVNDNAAKIVAESNGRIFSTACIPPWNFKENFYELERCVKELGAVGVQLACHYGDLHLDAGELRPMMKKIAELDVPVVVHHCPLPPNPSPQLLEFQNFRREFGRISSQAMAVGRELFSDLFEDVPELRLIHTMLGGNWFANATILTPKPSSKNEAMMRLSTAGKEKIEKGLKNNIFFDLTHPHSWGPEVIECALKVSGVDHYLFGSSFPVFYGWMKQGIEFINGLNISQADKEAVLFGNAKKMFNLPV